MGSYYNSTENKYLLCAKGSYQDMTGQMSCTMCPADTDTYGEGAAALSECIGKVLIQSSHWAKVLVISIVFKYILVYLLSDLSQVYFMVWILILYIP